MLFRVVIQCIVGAAFLAPFIAASAASHAQPLSSTALQPGGAPLVSGRAGCEVSGVQAGSTITLKPKIGGRSRTVLVHLSTGYKATKHYPLVLNLHGSGSDASQQEKFTGMDAAADAHAFIVAYPQANIPSGSGFDWNVPNEPLIGGAPVPAGSANDVSFLVKLVSRLERSYCISPRRVFVTGFSGGARLASQLGCAASSTFAAIAPVSGLRLPSPCPGRRSMPVIAFHGDADPVDPYSGHGQKYWTYSVPDAAKKWAAHDGCSSKPMTSHPAAGATLLEYSSCHGKAMVELYTLAGEGHEWPGGPHLPARITSLLGPQSNAVDADTVMWRFFEAHSMP